MCDDWTQMNFKRLGDNFPQSSCVYFLMNNIELIYIGQTKNLKQRIGNHDCIINPGIYVNNKKIVHDAFDGVYYLKVDDKKERRIIEKKYQDMYCPKLNWNYYEYVSTVDGSFVPLQRLLMELEEKGLYPYKPDD